MANLEDIKKDSIVSGIIPGHAVKIVTVERIGDDAITVYYRDPDDSLAERMLFRADTILFHSFS